jgi:hypothetical protein
MQSNDASVREPTPIQEGLFGFAEFLLLPSADSSLPLVFKLDTFVLILNKVSAFSLDFCCCSFDLLS